MSEEAGYTNQLIAENASLRADLQRMTEERDVLKACEFPHMCRDGHVLIGHRDNSSEMCPLCRSEAARRSLTARQEQLEMYVQHKDDCSKSVCTLTNCMCVCNCGLSALLTQEQAKR